MQKAPFVYCLRGEFDFGNLGLAVQLGKLPDGLNRGSPGGKRGILGCDQTGRGSRDTVQNLFGGFRGGQQQDLGQAITVDSAFGDHGGTLPCCHT